MGKVIIGQLLEKRTLSVPKLTAPGEDPSNTLRGAPVSETYLAAIRPTAAPPSGEPVQQEMRER
jgi:hypothetical protein